MIKLDPSQYKRINLSRRSIRDWRDLIGNGSIMSAAPEEESDIRPCQIFGCGKIFDLIYETRYQASYICIWDNVQALAEGEISNNIYEIWYHISDLLAKDIRNKVASKLAKTRIIVVI